MYYNILVWVIIAVIGIMIYKNEYMNAPKEDKRIVLFKAIVFYLVLTPIILYGSPVIYKYIRGFIYK